MRYYARSELFSYNSQTRTLVTTEHKMLNLTSTWHNKSTINEFYMISAKTEHIKKFTIYNKKIDKLIYISDCKTLFAEILN